VRDSRSPCFQYQHDIITVDVIFQLYVLSQIKLSCSTYVRTCTHTYTRTHLRKLDSPKDEMRPSGGVMLLFASTLPLLMLFCAKATGDEAALSGAASSCKAFSSSASASNIVISYQYQICCILDNEYTANMYASSRGLE
jgi:hypothetical protein